MASAVAIVVLQQKEANTDECVVNHAYDNNSSINLKKLFSKIRVVIKEYIVLRQHHHYTVKEVVQRNILVNRNIVIDIMAFCQCHQKEPYSNQSNPKSPM